MASLIGTARRSTIDGINATTRIVGSFARGLDGLGKQVELYALQTELEFDHKVKQIHRTVPRRMFNEGVQEMIEILQEQHEILFPGQPRDQEAINQKALDIMSGKED